MRITDMGLSERPREKLLAKGPEALSDGELLAILLRTGRMGESALELAQRLLGLTGGRLSGLFECDSGYLASLDGVGAPKAAALVAAFELGRRFMLEGAPGGIPIQGPKQIYELMRPRMKGLKHEECWVALFDRKNCLLKTVKLTRGGRRATVIDVPVIVRTALESDASGIILIHNHPTGDPLPSRADIRETAALRDACTSCSLSLLDHIIVADEHFYSFNEEKLF